MSTDMQAAICVVASKGERIAGSDFDSSKLGGDLQSSVTEAAKSHTNRRLHIGGHFQQTVSVMG